MRKKLCPKTLRLKGLIKDKKVNILIDFSCTHNYINIDLAKKFGLCICPIKDLTIYIATRKMFKGIRECDNVSIEIQELELQIDIFSLPLKEMDVFLGVEWLI